MYESQVLEGLHQGDLIAGVSLPLIHDDPKVPNLGFFQSGAKYKSPEYHFYPTEIKGNNKGYFAIKSYDGFCAVLSQSCDLEDIRLKRVSDWKNRRLLVSPVYLESVELRKEQERRDNTHAGVVMAGAALDAAPDEIEKKTNSANLHLIKEVSNYFEGKRAGVFSYCHLEAMTERGYCHFQNTVSVPALWYRYLLDHRVASLQDSHRVLMQEALRYHFGRYAAPFERPLVGLNEEEQAVLQEDYEARRLQAEARDREKESRMDPNPSPPPAVGESTPKHE